MKICLICLDRYSVFIDTANYLARDGYEVHVFCSREIANLKKGIHFHYGLIGKIDAEKSKFNVLTLPINAKKFRKKLEQIKPDVLHAFNLKWSGWISALCSYHPFILSGMGSDILKEQKAESNIILKYLKHYTINKADYITVVSKQMEEQVREINHNVPIDFFAPGADPEIFKAGEPQKDFVEKYDVPNNKIIFSPRGIRPVYQTKEIIKAFALLKKKFENVILISGGSEKTPYAYQTKELVKELHLEDSVYFTGRVKIEEWLEYYRLADFVVSFPYNDGMPATIFEAMTMEKPLILSNIPSTNEICRNDYDAIICDKNDIQSLANAFERLMFDESLRNNLGKNAKNTFKKKGNVRIYLRNLKNIYHELCSR